MPTVLRTDGLRIVIYLDDHEPAHVHVFGDGETKIELGKSRNAIRVIFSVNVKAGEKRRVERAVRDNHAHLLARWIDLNG